MKHFFYIIYYNGYIINNIDLISSIKSIFGKLKIDLRNSYNIYKKQLECINLYPNYTKDIIIKI